MADNRYGFVETRIFDFRLPFPYTILNLLGLGCLITRSPMRDKFLLYVLIVFLSLFCVFVIQGGFILR